MVGLLLFLPGSAPGQEADRKWDDVNLQSAERSFLRGFPAETRHYLDRIPANSEVRSSQQYLELDALIGLHNGSLVQARQSLKALYENEQISLSVQDRNVFNLYLLEELLLLRQYPALERMEPAQLSIPDYRAFANLLHESNYPLLVCGFATEEAALTIGQGLSPDKHRLFSNPLDFHKIRERKTNEGDALQLQVLSLVGAGYSQARQGRKVEPPESVPGAQWQELSMNLRLCRENLERQMEGQEHLSAGQVRWLREYLYRLYFSSWALNGSPEFTFELAGFLLRGSRTPDYYEALFLFRKSLQQLLSPELFSVQSHMDEAERDRRLHHVSSVLRKMQTAYEKLEKNGDARTIRDMALAVEAFLFSSEKEEKRFRRELLDVCGENRDNRESLVMRILLNPSEKNVLLRDLKRRDESRDGEELLSLMEFRYGPLNLD